MNYILSYTQTPVVHFPLAIAAGSPSEKVSVTQPDTILETCLPEQFQTFFDSENSMVMCQWFFLSLCFPKVAGHIAICAVIQMSFSEVCRKNFGFAQRWLWKIQTSHRNLGSFWHGTGTLWTCGWFSISQSTFPAAYSSLLVWPSLPFQGFLFSFHFISRYTCRGT